MGVINSMDDIVQALTTPGRNQHPSFAVDNRIADTAGPGTSNGFMTSFWRLNKTNGANGKAPDGVTYLSGACDRTTLGAMPFKPSTEGSELRLLGWEGSIFSTGTMILYDRLGHAGPFLGNNTNDQMVNLAAPRNNVNGEGNEIWIEIFTIIGATSVTATAVYTNQSGDTKTTPAITIGGTNHRDEGRVLKFPLADGDTGVLGVTSVRIGGTANVGTGVAGNFAVVLARPITAALCEAAGSSFFRDFIGGIPSVPLIDNNACLALMLHSAGGGTLRGNFQLHMIEV